MGLVNAGLQYGKENGLYIVQGRVNCKNRIQLLPRYLMERI